jgi:hypothetical protein
MLLAAIVLWLLIAFVFWCMMAGATRGDLQIEAALDRAKDGRVETRPLIEEAAGDPESLSNAA